MIVGAYIVHESCHSESCWVQGTLALQALDLQNVPAHLQQVTANSLLGQATGRAHDPVHGQLGIYFGNGGGGGNGAGGNGDNDDGGGGGGAGADGNVDDANAAGKANDANAAGNANDANADFNDANDGNANGFDFDFNDIDFGLDFNEQQ